MGSLITIDNRVIVAPGPSPFGQTIPAGAQTRRADTGLVVLADGVEGRRTISHAEIYETQQNVAAVVNKLVRAVSTVPLRTYRRLGSGGAEPVEDPAHPLVRLLRNPAPRKGEVALKQWMMLPGAVHGNAILAKFRPDGPESLPTGLLPLDWRYMSAWARPGLPVEWWETIQLGTPKWIDAGGVVHLAWESATAGDIGVSPLKQLGTTLKLEDAAQRFSSSSFNNAARPSGAIVLPAEADLDETERKEMREDIQLMHGGVDRAFRVALLSGGADWKPMSFNASEAQLLESRRHNREDVCVVYDVKPPAIGIMDDANYSNLVEVHRDFYVTSGAAPWLGLIADTLNVQLVEPEPAWREEGLFVAFDLTEVLKGDPKTFAESQKLEIESGTLTPHEGRRRQGRTPYPDEQPKNPADRLYLPVNNLSPIGSEPTAAPAELGAGGD